MEASISSPGVVSSSVTQSVPSFLQLALSHEDQPEKAVVYLFSLISSSLEEIEDDEAVYQLLVKLLFCIIEKSNWVSQLQPFLNKTPLLIKAQENLALSLARLFSAGIQPSHLDSYATAAHYYAKVLSFASIKQYHEETSHLFFCIIRDQFKQTLDLIRREGKKEAFERFLYQIDRWKEFGATKEDQKELCDQALEVLAAVPEASKAQYTSYIRFIGKKLQEPFTSPACYVTEKYRQKLAELREAFAAPSTDIRAYQRAVSQKWSAFFHEVLVQDAFTILGPPPCGYDIRAMGSVGREEPCRFSDLEYFILIEKESCRPYFTRLAHVLELQIISLGETAPTDLLIFTAFGPKHRSGLHVDFSPTKDSQEFIALPEKLAGYVILGENLAPNSFKNMALKTTSLCSNHQALYETFAGKLKEGSWQERRALSFLRHRLDSYKEKSLKTTTVNLKEEFVSFLNYAISDLGLLLKIPAGNTLDTIDALSNLFTPNTRNLLKEAVQNIYRIRLRLHSKEQKEEASLVPSNDLPVLLSSEIADLEKIRILLIEPLYFFLGTLFKNNSLTPDLFKEKFSSVDLPSNAFTDLLSHTDNLLPLQTLLTHLVPSLKELKEHMQYYGALSKDSHFEPLRKHYLSCISDLSLLSELAPIPNIDGYRQSTRLSEENLKQAILDITDTNPTAVQLKASFFTGPRFLRQKVIDQIIEPKTGEIGKKYPNSSHRVFPARYGDHSLHFKQMPLHPLMEYAIYSLNSRLTHKLSPPTQLVHFVIDGKIPGFPVLISETIPGSTLASGSLPQNLDPFAWKQWTWMILSTLLTKPGDGRKSNYIFDSSGRIFCVDNDISFVEPAVKAMFSRRQVHFRSVLFFLFSDRHLDPEVLTEFCSLHTDSLLDGWIEDVIAKEKEYVGLFDETKRKNFYSDSNTSFRAALLLREGTLATLNLQFWRLQNFLASLVAENKSVMALDLLKELITLREDYSFEAPVGIEVYKKYERAFTCASFEERCKQVTDSVSLSVSQSDIACLGKIPTFEEIEKKQLYSPAKARQELFYTLLSRISSQAYSGEIQGARVIKADFTDFDMPRQELVLQALLFTLQLHTEKPTSVTLKACNALDSKKLLSFLHDKLEYLDLSGCEKIYDKDIVEIAARCPSLKILHLNECNGLTTLAEGLLFSNPLFFSSLEEIYLKNCSNLTTLQIETHDLKVINLDENVFLKDAVIITLTLRPQLSARKCLPTLLEKLQNELMEITLQSFGATAWKHYFGEVGKAPPLPANIRSIINSPCPFWPNKKVQDTHLLVLIPQTVNGKPLTLQHLGELIQKPLQGPSTKYRSFYIGEYKDNPTAKSHWALLTRDVIEGSRDKSYSKQQALIQGKKHYEVPTILDATVAILMEHVRTGTRLYSDSPYTYTRCQEKYNKDYQLGVGGFSGAGLYVNFSFYVVNVHVGVGGLRKF